MEIDPGKEVMSRRDDDAGLIMKGLGKVPRWSEGIEEGDVNFDWGNAM